MTREIIGHLSLGIIMLLVLIGFAASIWDTLVNKDRASLITLTVLAVLAAGAVWGLNG